MAVSRSLMLLLISLEALTRIPKCDQWPTRYSTLSTFIPRLLRPFRKASINDIACRRD